MCYVLSRGLWEMARPHMAKLVAQTRESTSIAQLDGSDIVYVAHAAETPLDVLIGKHLPLLLQAAGAISSDWAACQGVPQVTISSS